MMSTENDKARELVYLAGLLHDIGKFDKVIENSWRTNPFYQKPSDVVTAIINKADTWATAIDQQEDEADVITPGQPLANLFGNVQIDGKSGTRKAFGFHKLSLDAGVVLQQTPGDLQTLRERFTADFQKLPADDIRVFSETLYHLLRQYCWCLPASGQSGFGSISLFHHLKLTGAFAQCLYDFEHDADPGKSKLPLQLLCVDLSGIQSFIYHIGSKYAAKSLKGRSFSLQLLLDSIARQLIQETGTTPSHLVYSSGGKFFMLLSNTKNINATLKRVKTNIQTAIWNTYQGNLFVCFGSVAFDYNPDSKVVTTGAGDGKVNDLSQLWKLVTQKAAEQKTQKNRALLLDESKFEALFGPTGSGGDTKQCPVTGWEGPLEKLKDKTKVHPTVKTQIDIGSKLADSHFITLGEGEFQLLPTSDETPEVAIPPFGFDKPTASAGQTEYSQLMQPGQENNFLHGRLLSPAVRSFRFYGGSEQARSVLNERLPKNFEELTGIVRENPEVDDSPIKERDGKYNRLAVLRMDVDSLGKLFTGGLPAEKATFSAYATLSGLLDWFFSGYLNTIRDKTEFKDWVNIIYSGGDDVFAVGRWDKIIDFADCVQQDFKTFTGCPDLTISAGIFLMRPRFPIGKAADAAGEAEDLAKDFNKDKKLFSKRHEKDAVSLFDVAVGWEEFTVIRKMKEQWGDWLTKDVLSKGVLRSMFDWYEIATRKDKRTNEPLNDQSWRWNAAYSLARQRSRDPDSPKNQALDILKLVLMCGQFKDNQEKTHLLRFEAFIVACRWAELTFRDHLAKN